MAILIVVTIFIRWLVIRGGNFPFWFDSARDAVVSREILEKHHLKLQGPNASGTHDTVFHGVLYYYLIGPLYTLFHGDPQMVAYVLGLITSLAIIPVYLLADDISGSKKTAAFAALLYTFSYDAVRAGTWVSNPTLTALTIPLFAYLLWLTFFRHQKKYLPWLALVLGLSTQSVIFFVTLGGEVLLAAWYAAQYHNFQIRKKEWLIAAGVFLLSISTMIFAELKMIKLGLLTPSTFADFSLTAVSGSGAVVGTLDLFFRKITQVIFPTFPVAAMILFSFAAISLWRQKNRDANVFLLLTFTTPLWIIGWLFRDMYHAFIGMEAIICIIVALWLSQVSKYKMGKIFITIFFGIYILSQTRMWQTERAQRLTPYFLPQGAYLKDQLALIDKTYELSDGKPFSISTLTNPYGYNVEWAYLYSWYGQKKYGRVPNWFGPDQTGLFGSDLLPRTLRAEKTHFTIYEPPEGIPVYIRDAFKQNQDALIGTPSATMKFGTMIIEVHQ